MNNLFTLKAIDSKRSRRVGRGMGSGRGKTCGRGTNGQSSRTGEAMKFTFEGGQFPFFRKIPKFGFSNNAYRKKYYVVRLCELNSFADGSTIDKVVIAKMKKSNANLPAKIILNGELKTKNLKIVDCVVTKGARLALINLGAEIVATDK